MFRTSHRRRRQRKPRDVVSLGILLLMQVASHNYISYLRSQLFDATLEEGHSCRRARVKFSRSPDRCEADAMPGVVEVALQVPELGGVLRLSGRCRVPRPDDELAGARL